MVYEVEFTDEFEDWWNGLTLSKQASVSRGVELLEVRGPALGRPHVDTLRSSLITNLKELRIQHQGRPLRILFVFDPRRVALLLLGGDKTGDALWYTVNIRKAEAIYLEHLSALSDQ